MSFCVDANVFITSWNDTYPRDIFDSLWKQLTECKQQLCIIQPIWNEIDPIPQHHKKRSIEELRREYPLKCYLQENEFKFTLVDREVQNSALELQKEYETREGGNGANKNDIILITYTKACTLTVVTLEREQPSPPQNLYDYKIPLICQKEGVACVNPVEMFRQLGIKI